MKLFLICGHGAATTDQDVLGGASGRLAWVVGCVGGGLLPSTSERFPEGMQNTLKISVADPNQLFFSAPSLSDTVPHSHIQATTFN